MTLKQARVVVIFAITGISITGNAIMEISAISSMILSLLRPKRMLYDTRPDRLPASAVTARILIAVSYSPSGVY